MEAFLRSQEMIKKSLDETLDLMGPEENLNKYVDLVEKRLKKYGQTGDVKYLDNIFGENPIKKRHKKGSKENISTDSTKHPSKTSKQKVLQNVLEITEEDNRSSNQITEVIVKQEMPPPTMLPKRGRPKKQAIVIKKEPEDKFRDSDVILQVPVIPTIDLRESDELHQVEPKSTTRSTRATTTKIKVVEELKDHSSIYEDALPQIESNPKPVADDMNTKPSGDFYSTPPKIVDTSPNSISKGTITKPKTMEQALNETIIIQKPRVLDGTIESNAVPVKNDILNKDNNGKPSRDGPTLNETIVRPRVLNETIVLHKGPSKDGALKNKIIEDIMTDDEDPPIVEKANKKKYIPVKHGKKDISQYEISPVKKKIEAFEKLATTPRMTRTKTRKLKEYEEDQKLQVEEPNQKVAKQEKSGASKQKTSATSPFVGAANKFNFKSGSASTKPNRFLKTPEMSTKAISAYKASQEEYREREKQKREKDADVLRKKEDEALQKKEAMLQASIEQKKRKREEKELKAKEHREALEQAEKQKVLVMQKQKEEKHKMNLLGIAEKLQKNKEESERKRLLIKQKKQEMLRKDNPLEKKHKPIYLVKNMPLLPTYDCYDSDEKDFPESRMEKPAWLKREKMHEGIRLRGLIMKSYVNTLFCLKPRTPNLEDIFENIDPEKLVRKSSAVWKNQPRFTCMPKIHEAH